MGEARAQSNLVALAIAVLVLTAAIGLALTIAGAPFASPRPSPTAHHLATGVAATLLADDSPLTRRAGVLNATALHTVTPTELRHVLALPPSASVHVRFEDRALTATDPIEDGATVRRLVTVTRWTWSRSEPPLEAGATFTVGPTPVLTLGVAASNTTVQSVRIDGRIVLNRTSGISTPVTITLPPGEAVTVTVTTRGAVSTGDIWVATPTVHTETGVLVVSVDA